MSQQGPSTAVRMVDHVHMFSTDPQATVDFYVKHFGAEQGGTFAGDDRTDILFHLAGQLFAVGDFPAGIAPQQPSAFVEQAYSQGYGIAHIGLWIEDMESLLTGLRADGIEILGGPFVEGDTSTVYVAAPGGVVLEVAQRGG